MNLKRTRDLSQPIRLPRQTGLPTPKDIIEMSNESRRSKKRVELPWHPEGRPEPVILTVRFDDFTGKSHWMLYDGIRAEASVVWSASDPDPTKVVLAMRDWYSTARLAEGWGGRSLPDIKPRKQLPEIGPPAAPAPAPAVSAACEQPADPANQPPDGQASPVLPGQPYPPLIAGAGTPAVPYPVYIPVAYVPPLPPSWPAAAPNVYPPASPAHWAHGYPESTMAQVPAEAAAQGVESPPSMMLGDLLVAAGVIPTRTLQAALTLQNTSQMERRRIGEILLNAGAIPRQVLQAAVKLQEMARQGSIPNNKVTELLKRVHSSGMPLEELLEKPAAGAQPAAHKQAARLRPSDEQIELESRVTEGEQRKLKQVMALLKKIEFSQSDNAARAARVMDLLKKAAIVSDAQYEEIKQAANAADAMKSLLVKEVVDPLTFEVGWQCQTLLDDERLKPEQAIIAIGYCQRSRVSLKEAITELNWLIATDDL